jgi:hypothetical protein
MRPHAMLFVINGSICSSACCAMLCPGLQWRTSHFSLSPFAVIEMPTREGKLPPHARPTCIHTAHNHNPVYVCRGASHIYVWAVCLLMSVMRAGMSCTTIEMRTKIIVALYRLIHWNFLRAPFWPGFFRSTMRGSRWMSLTAPKKKKNSSNLAEYIVSKMRRQLTSS